MEATYPASLTSVSSPGPIPRCLALPKSPSADYTRRGNTGKCTHQSPRCSPQESLGDAQGQLELELTQTNMTQKLMLRDEVDARALHVRCACKSGRGWVVQASALWLVITQRVLGKLWPTHRTAWNHKGGAPEDRMNMAPNKVTMRGRRSNLVKFPYEENEKQTQDKRQTS